MQIRFIIILGLTLLLAACSAPEADQGTLIDIEEEFLLQPIEKYTRYGREVGIRITTIDLQPCENSEIILNYSGRGNGNTFLIQVDDIHHPDTCLQPGARISEDANLGVLSPDIYQVNLKVEGLPITSEGNLEVHKDVLYYTLPADEGFRIDDEEVLRVPDNVIWGFAGTDQSDFHNALINFLTDLHLISDRIELEDGLYSQFEIKGGFLHEYLEPYKKYSNLVFFTHSFEGDDSQLEDLIKFYRDDVDGNAEFSIFDTKGNSF